MVSDKVFKMSRKLHAEAVTERDRLREINAELQKDLERANAGFEAEEAFRIRCRGSTRNCWRR